MRSISRMIKQMRDEKELREDIEAQEKELKE
jgi:hypothetical protein